MIKFGNAIMRPPATAWEVHRNLDDEETFYVADRETGYRVCLCVNFGDANHVAQGLNTAATIKANDERAKAKSGLVRGKGYKD